jgi:hypothetical protein
MQFLLLLSALLSALTGGFVGPRAPEPQANQVEAQQESVLASPVRAAAAVVALAPARPLRTAVSQPPPAIVSAPAPSAPLTSVRWLE